MPAANSIELHDSIEYLGLLESTILIEPAFENAKQSKKINRKKLPYIKNSSNIIESLEYIEDRKLDENSGSNKTNIDNTKDNKIVILMTDIFHVGFTLFNICLIKII